MEGLGFEYRPYRRPFRQALHTSHGVWRDREGILLRLTHAAGIGWGEIAPLPWFGSETLAQALNFCRYLPAEISAATIDTIPDSLPACHFGFESALESLTAPLPSAPLPLPLPSLPRSSALLPTGESALQTWQPLWNKGHRTFKWKIGVTDRDQELTWFHHLIQQLPGTAKLRLDANGGLDLETTMQWLDACDRAQPTLTLEYLEQPLPPKQFDTMLSLSQRYITPLALDESVATVPQIQACYQAGWRGVFVIKPAIAGSPRRLRQFCRHQSIDAVFSSVFETAIGQQAGQRLAAELGNPDRAWGYGTNHWFDTNEDDFEQLWQTC